jgi:DNA-binding CsgD family transcriptional regulator
MEEVLGRRVERAELVGLLGAARQGESRSLVLQGDAGMGKTSLLDFAVATAGDFDVVRIDGFESEQDLAFAGMQRLLVPFLDGVSRLPGPQRSALESAFGLQHGAPPNRFLVGLGTLSLLAEVASARPLLCVVDDAHCLDDESLSVLGFVARRLHAERIAMLFASRGRDDPTPLEGIPTRLIQGLADDEAHELLRLVVDRPLDVAVAQRVVAESMGSPMALLEIGKGLREHQLLSDDSWSGPLPLSRRLEAHFLRQVEGLPGDTQSMLLLAAAEPSGDRSLIESAASALGLTPDATDAAEAAAVIIRSDGLRFRHPLVRSAVYNGAAITDRRRAHQVLAETIGDLGDPDRRAWHLGAATAGPDGAVAAELHEAAERALVRGGCAASATFFTRSAELTPDRATRAERALAAAERHLIAGFRVRSRRVLDEFAGDITDPHQRARASRLEGNIRYTIGEVDGTVGLLLDAAKTYAPFDIRSARDTLLDALTAARIPGSLSLPGERMSDVASVAHELTLPPGATPTIGDLLLDGYVALLHGDQTTGHRRLSEALVALEADHRNDEAMLRWLGMGCWAAGTLGDDEALRRIASRLETTARAHGAIVPLTLALTFRALNELGTGELVAARAHLVERDELSDILGRPRDIGRLLTMAWNGDEAGTRAEAAAVAAAAQQRRHGWMLVFVDQAMVVLELGLGHYAAALSSASASYHSNPFFATADFPNLIEAATRSGAKALAHEAVAEYATRTEARDTPLARSLLARARALAADDASAEDCYREAIAWLDDSATIQHARARLVFGEWLRRQKRRTEAREHLRAALEIFAVTGAHAFAARAERELAATGERARRRGYDSAGELTPQESQIAHLAGSGATNQEIAAKLFLSPSTVDYHLRKVFRKLGITSRRQLGSVLLS